MARLADTDVLAAELRELVRNSVAQLGRVIEREAGAEIYGRIEGLRREMVELRDRDEARTLPVLRQTLEELRAMGASDRETVARAFTLMLELMNSCENAYRSHRLASGEAAPLTGPRPDAIVYVMTAHPTEARSPNNIAVFHEIQRILMRGLAGRDPAERLQAELFHQLQLAWRVGVVRERVPEVSDEAEHIYSTLFEEGIIDSLLYAGREVAPVYLRSWVGGDKDGHPGVDEKTMRTSLSLSRRHLVRYAECRLQAILTDLDLMPGKILRPESGEVRKVLSTLRQLRDGDGARVEKLRRALGRFERAYEKAIGSVHPSIGLLRQLLRVFPGFVIPLELRESSDVLMESEAKRKRVAIDRMLSALSRLARGGDPRWYARGFIISMASSIDHVRAARAKLQRTFGRASLPVIPLFEQRQALLDSGKVAREILRDKVLGRDVREIWGGFLEVMVGYSDSAKESGVLASRLSIAEAMNRLDAICGEEGVRPLFFQGSGGSVDRGGGSVQDQTAWWPRSALRLYKVTIQGEMVERSLASPEITRGQVERIAESVGASLASPAAPPRNEALRDFASRVAEIYGATIADEAFLRIVERATPYLHLKELKIGSRPTSRKLRLSVAGLRAIPWVLCWTQTRVLFPTWWGVGSAWEETSPAARAGLRKAFAEEPVFRSYVKALGFTLAKVELPTWRLYLEASRLEAEETERIYARVKDEFAAALSFLREVTGEETLLWFRPWLGASIRLRSPMIHPLNLLQVIAMEKRDPRLLRLTVTGVASGMLTTG